MRFAAKKWRIRQEHQMLVSRRRSDAVAADELDVSRKHRWKKNGYRIILRVMMEVDGVVTIDNSIVIYEWLCFSIVVVETVAAVQWK